MGFNLYLSQFFLVTARQWEGMKKKGGVNIHIRKIKEFLENNYDNDFRIAELSAALTCPRPSSEDIKRGRGEHRIRAEPYPDGKSLRPSFAAAICL